MLLLVVGFAYMVYRGVMGNTGANGEGSIPGSLLQLAQGISPPSGYTFIATTKIQTGGTKKHPTYLTTNIYQ